jgi:hypothetical protein
MIRKAASKILILAAVTLATGAVALNCSKKSDQDDVGSVGLALVLPGGGIVNTVNYAITGGTLTMPLTGSIDVSAPGTTQATALVSGLAPGSYTVTMTATSSDMQNCSGMSPFTVVANQTAMANVILQCTRTGGRGSVAIMGRIDQCPLITAINATSLQGIVGGPAITVGVVASELDTGDVLTYAWTANPTGIGTLGGNTASTTFTCTAAGSTQLSISVSDGICGDAAANAIPITCIAGSTGTAGRGGTTGTGGSAGAGTGGSAGAGTGGSAGAGTGGSAGAGTGGSAGAGTGGTAGSAGRGGSGGGGTAGTGGMACIETNPPAALVASCTACLNANLNPTTDGCCGITDATGLALCQTASACMRSGSCNLSGDVTTCFCGTNQATCDAAGAANGPCVAQVTAAAGRNVVTGVTDAPTAAQVLARQGDPAYALGRAANIQGIAGAFCPAECGF